MMRASFKTRKNAANRVIEVSLVVRGATPLLSRDFFIDSICPFVPVFSYVPFHQINALHTLVLSTCMQRKCSQVFERYTNEL